MKRNNPIKKWDREYPPHLIPKPNAC